MTGLVNNINNNNNKKNNNKRIMVAGVGNILIQDDGFGVEVARKLKHNNLPAGVEIEDSGTGSMRMAHKLMEGYDTLIIVDIAKRGGKPGALYVIEPDFIKEDHESIPIQVASRLSGHTLGSDDIFSLIKIFNAWPKKILLVCCEPLSYEEYRIGLSKPVQDAVDRAVKLIQSIIAKEMAC